MSMSSAPWWERFYAGRNKLLWPSLVDGSAPDGWSGAILPWIEYAKSADPDLPVVLPFIDRHTGQLSWYAGSRSKLGILRLREELQAFVGPSYSDFSGRPYELDMSDSVETALSEGCSAPVFHFSATHPEFSEKIRRALTYYVDLLAQRKHIKADVQRPFGVLRSEFERALLAGDEVEARVRFEEMLRVGRLGVENRLFLEVRLLAGMGRWRQIAEDKEMLHRLCDLTLPPRVLADVIEALYLSYIEVVEDPSRPERALQAFRKARLNHFGHLFSTLRGLTLPRVIKAFGLFELCRDTPNWQRLESLIAILDEGPDKRFVDSLLQLFPGPPKKFPTTDDFTQEAERAFDDLDYERALDGYIQSPPSKQRLSRLLICARQIGTQDVAERVLSLLQTEQRDELEGLGGRLRVELEKLYHQARPLGDDVVVSEERDESRQGWLNWVRWVVNGATAEHAIEMVKRNFLSWDTTRLLRDPIQMEEISVLIGNAEGQSATVFREAYPELYQAFVPDIGVPGRNAKLLLSTLLTNTVLSDGPSIDELELVRQLTVALLNLGLSEKEYGELVDDLRDLFSYQASLSTLNWALDVAEVLLLYPCPVAEVRLRFVTDLLGLVSRMTHRLSAVHRVVVGEICKDLGLEELPIEIAEEGEGIGADTIATNLDGLRIAIYTLTEPAGKRAASTLKAICPSVTVQLNSDKECTEALKLLAKSVDLFVFAWKSSKHQAFYCVKDHRPSGWPILLPLGKGSSSILREIIDTVGGRLAVSP